MYELYWSADTGAFAVQAVLEELGQAYERVVVDTREGRHREPGYTKLNPMQQVPSLRLPDGTVITESAAMVLHLCDAHPERGLLPAPGTTERAVAYRWLFWLATGLYETDLRYYYPERYTADPAGAPAVKQAAHERLDRLVAMAAELLGAGPWVLGERFSAVDIYLFMLVLWHPARAAIFERHPGLGEHARRLRARPAVDRIWALNFPAGRSVWSTWTGSSAS
ncbi:glutathione S-transferase family protein [Benzoatithermus flavus]|uniref:Glutathione S-transferase family protein n=1 Tax=Benzoatithermus flavus TaxID=3108223 RepID=A0ABU8XRC0_9PROT